MLRTQLFLLALALALFDLLSTTTAKVIWHNEIEGDYLTSTFCYCTSRATSGIGESPSHYFQFDYFNRRLEKLFTFSDKCTPNVTEAHNHCIPTVKQPTLAGGSMGKTPTCWFNPRQGDGSVDDSWMDDDLLPARHPRSKRAPMEDKFCYLPGRRGKEYFQFNKQKRLMTDEGHQGLVWMSKEESEGECRTMCKEEMGMDLFVGRQDLRPHNEPDVGDRDGWLPQSEGQAEEEPEDMLLSQQVYYTEMDDMCDGCP
ncbi:hypothetical protein MMC28_001718 [Mycoblastus sanguinarius]|nr:hypothetical protein [Mycoblastus sanguinarius]